MSWLKNLIEEIRLFFALRRKVKKMKKTDPFIYK